MRINGISNSFYRNNGKTNNQTSFTALKGIKYDNFYPKKYLKEAEAVLAFKKSEPLKKFFEKYDGYAEFSKGFSETKKVGYASLDIKYSINPISTKKVETIEHIKKTPQKTASLVTEDIETPNSAIFCLLGSGNCTEDAIDDLTKIIKNLKFEDIEERILSNKKFIEQEKQNAIRLKNILEEIKDLV